MAKRPPNAADAKSKASPFLSQRVVTWTHEISPGGRELFDDPLFIGYLFGITAAMDESAASRLNPQFQEFSWLPHAPSS
ncbi:hypothetical protein PAAG_11873 [Paracoccidioides lutzii Pb01]|uniref:Uncharacterized protein n=1 Tax=Paracoccidioides lutzii (strain ATCC MYA-826 / Pb01) TaxID=502779 RepID=A0A0A2VKI9_PARBA|nr:hypothetical protein PAAG_11873 [Paracoccidioides lutzii Pb01]KGQ01409.1 hypothetical protein PAAG_11873 [Paracoccidioides lutzii Pb01]